MLQTTTQSRVSRPSRTAPRVSWETRRTIVVSVAPCADSVTALVRAHDLARVIGARLRLVQAVPESVQVASRRRIGPSLVAVPWVLEEARVRLRAWGESVLHRTLEKDQATVRVGDPIDVVAHAAEELDAILVVIGAHAVGSLEAGRWTSLVRRARRPLLVARAPRDPHEIIAATDFTDQDLPTLVHADTFARLLSASLTLVHNIPPGKRGVATVLGTPVPEGVAYQFVAARYSRLSGFLRAHQPSLGGDALIARQDDAVSGILRGARRRDCDLIVVGAHGPMTRRTGRRPHTADRLITVAKRSVLVVPMGPKRRTAP